LAWAITIHKSQGLTLEMAEVDVGDDIFECGQTYVALSRVKSLEGLYLTSFEQSKIKVNEKVIEFYANLNSKLNSNINLPVAKVCLHEDIPIAIAELMPPFERD
jgi:ATP-dependent DNA helicase PIF1